MAIYIRFGKSSPRDLSKISWNEIMNHLRAVLAENYNCEIDFAVSAPELIRKFSESSILSNAKLSNCYAPWDNRVLRDGMNATVAYKSGKQVPGKIKIAGDLAIIEGSEYGTAAFIIDVADLESTIDLQKTAHIRICHTKKGMAELKELVNG